MQVDVAPLLQKLLQKVLPLSLNFLDDALLFAVSKIGLHLPWLQGLTTVFWTLSLLYWAFRIGKFFYRRYYTRGIEEQV